MRLFGLILLVVTASCVTPARAAEAQAANIFAHSETCPIERVAVSEQSEAPSVREALLADYPPPKELADDPERVDLWIADHERRGRSEGTKLREFSVEGCDMTAQITCADGVFGLRKCSIHDRHDLKLDELSRKMKASIERDRQEMCSQPMAWNFGDLCKPRSGP